MRYVYADNAATTSVSKKVVEAMLPYMTEHFGNPSSLYGIGQTAASAVRTARQQVATALGADEKEIFFTSGGSEADNWAIKGAAALGAKKGTLILLIRTRDTRGTREVKQPVQVMWAARGRVKTQTKRSASQSRVLSP